MIMSKLQTCAVIGMLLCRGILHGQTDTAFKSISLDNLDAFNAPQRNWVIASNATADFTKQHDIKAVKGTGAIVDDFSKNSQMHLYTKEEFGDLELELDFMMAKESNSGVYLQGRYEIQLLDSWTKLNPGSGDVGGIYARWNSQRGSYEGTAPVMNVAKAPGLWQHLQISFRAPRFNEQGVKIKNARFEKVYLNGQLVQQAADITGPTTSAVFEDEKPRGPLVLQGDHGPVAFRNLRYREPAATDSTKPIQQEYWDTRNPIVLNPGVKNYLLRSFFEFGNRTLTHVISVGSPAGTNFAYDIKQGALISIWRGNFLDASRMWTDRGEPQIARPLGSITPLSDAPAVATLANETAPWPDSIAFDDQQPHGYLVNKKGTPVFSYAVKGIEVKDSIACEPDGTGITRALTISGNPANFYCRVIAGNQIDKISDDLYAVNDRSFYVRIDKKFKAVLRASGTGKEIIVRNQNDNPIIYSIIW